MKVSFSLALLAAAALPALAAEAPPADTPEAAAHVAKATALAGSDLTKPLFLCQPSSTSVVVKALKEGSKQWVEPTRFFDNLSYVGNEFVGVYVLRTSAGLILFDSSQSTEEARDHLVPGLKALGLDPQTIRYVIVTHGHYDHFGGANYLKATYGARIGLSDADWTMIEHQSPDAPERNHVDPPSRDLVITDGQKLTLGDTTVTLYVTPGHTPGTVSAIIPAREGGRTFQLSLLGSTAFPPTLEATERTGGLIGYEHSIKRFARISAEADASGFLNTHIFGDGSAEKLALARARHPGDPNPFLVGADAVGRYYGVLDECLLAAEARPAKLNAWPAPPKVDPS